MRTEVDPLTTLDEEDLTEDEIDQDIITIHVTIIMRNGTRVINTDTMTIVLVGMIDVEETRSETETEMIDHTKIVATLTGVLADILNLTNTNVRIVMTTDDVAAEPGPDLPPRKNLIHATVLIQSPKKRSPRM